MSKTFRTLMNIVTRTTRDHRCEQRHGDAPERLPLGRAVGPRGLEYVARHRREPGRDHDHREAGPDPDVGDQERRDDEARPEPRVAGPGLGEGGGADACLVGPGVQSVNVERSRRRGSSSSARSCRSASSSTRHAWEPCSPCSTLPGHAAARLEVAPDGADDVARLRRAGVDRLLRARRHFGRRDRRQADQRDAARVERRLQDQAAVLRDDVRRRRCGAREDARRREDVLRPPCRAR